MTSSMAALTLLAVNLTFVTEIPVVERVAAQPLLAQSRRLEDALVRVGHPLEDAQRQALAAASELPTDAEVTAAVQAVFDPLAVAAVEINPESRVKVHRGPATAELVQNGWRAFLVKVVNEAGVTAPLQVQSPQAADVHRRSTGSPEPADSVRAADVRERWLDVDTFDLRPLLPTLSGLRLEYRIVELYSRDAGPREATLAFDVGQGTADLGFRGEVAVLFDSQPSIPVTFRVRDFDGAPTTAGFEIRDVRSRVLPAPSKRLAPDFFFHPQVYREDGESVQLAAGTYDVRVTRGPEYLPQERRIVVPSGARQHSEEFQLERWIHPRAHGYVSSDHHVHAGGCAHYESPTAGVRPEDMFRQQQGEGLDVALVLSWGPCWYFQKQFFEAEPHALSDEHSLLRYDVEVSGFPSSHCGHLCLLDLDEDDYPGTTRIEEWPSWDLPILKWAKSQGAITGFAHTGFGLEVVGDELPSAEVPAMDGIGANEYVMDVTHGVVDFLSLGDTPYTWELNVWYHTLNCGFPTRVSGETDFPCIYGERVGMGRAYCKIDGALTEDAFFASLRTGRSYVGDGRSHLFDFRVGDVEVGTGESTLTLDGPESVAVTVRAAALLNPQPEGDIRERDIDDRPYWHVERARLGESRRVPVELVVDGRAVDRIEIEANGSIHDLEFTHSVERSCWIALRILPSSHTNPVFVRVDDAPIRASARSARWCLAALERCHSQKRPGVRPAEREAMDAAYDHARRVYEQILAECPPDGE